MEDALSNLFFQLVNNYGVFGGIAIIVIVLALTYTLILVIKEFILNNEKIKQFRLHRKHKMQVDKHPIFSDLDYLVNYRLKHVKVDCPIRKQLYIDIITQRIVCMKEKLYGLALRSDINKISQNELKQTVFMVLEQANTMSINNSLKNGVPYFILKLTQDKREKLRPLYEQLIKDICYSVYLYNNNTERLYSILSNIETIIKSYTNLLQGSLAQFNGDIKTLNYKNIKCQNCKICVHEQYLEKLKHNNL